MISRVGLIDSPNCFGERLYEVEECGVLPPKSPDALAGPGDGGTVGSAAAVIGLAIPTQMRRPSPIADTLRREPMINNSFPRARRA